MATARRPTADEAKERSVTNLTLADTYGLGLMGLNIAGVDKEEIVAYLSPTAQKIAKAVTKQPRKKNATSKRRVAMKR